MPLTLVIGPANSAKAGEVLGAYAGAAARGDAVLVVPTAADAAHYDRELAAGGVVLGRALTFGGLCREIASRAGYVAARLSPLQRERVLRRVIAGLELQLLRDSAAAPGFAPAATGLIAELERNLVTPQRFAQALGAWAGADERRGRYGRELSSLYGAYARELERLGRVDAELHAWRALDALRADPRRWGRTPAFFYGFDDLTALERDAIETLARIAGAEVTVSLTYEPGRAALAARAPSVEALRALATEVRELPTLDEHYAPGARTALHHLERALFEPDPPVIDPGEAVCVLEAGGERTEAEQLADEVAALLTAALPAGEIVVVCRSLRRTGALLERVLSRRGITVASERTVPFGHTALGRALLALGRLALLPADHASAEDLVAYLRAPGLLERPEPVDRLEAEIRCRALHSAADARELTDLRLGEIDSLRAAARDPLSELARHVRRLLAAPHRRLARRLDGEEQLDARAAVAALAALSELEELGDPGDTLTAAELLELLAGLEVPAGPPPAPGAVLIAEPLAIRARRFRAVLVCGLCEGEFPAPAGADPFLGDERRRELALASGLALGAGEDALARERYLLYACVSRATERVVLSYRSSDEDGQAVAPSPFLADLAELFVPAWWERRRRRGLTDYAVPAPADAAAWHGVDGSDEARDAAPSPVPATRTLSHAALAHVRHHEVVSAGALEAFAKCPVAWLVERQLEPRELAPEPEPLVRGSFMHDVLERVIGALGGPVSEVTLAAAEALVDECTAELPPGLAAGRPPAVRAAILRGIEADLRRYLRHEARGGPEWQPRELELRFGFDDGEASLPPLELTAGEDRALVRGVIDRIDVERGGGSRAIVRDYKSGSGRIERAGGRWAGEHQLQVALYMIAVRRLLALEPVAGFYQPLTGRELRPRGAYLDGVEVPGSYSTDRFDGAALEALLDELEAQAVGLAASIRAGELSPCPETCSRDGCLHPGICWAA
ncbi:MAG TPA: PD-(D/E)XK nuclease family protein [Solirubrobacteraceae bacterium]|nr:PD-(D/E)XK nuclease family protein [Solirubrobacteraceae bacterium]